MLCYYVYFILFNVFSNTTLLAIKPTEPSTAQTIHELNELLNNKQQSVTLLTNQINMLGKESLTLLKKPLEDSTKQLKENIATIQHTISALSQEKTFPTSTFTLVLEAIDGAIMCTQTSNNLAIITLEKWYKPLAKNNLIKSSQRIKISQTLELASESLSQFEQSLPKAQRLIRAPEEKNPLAKQEFIPTKKGIQGLYEFIVHEPVKTKDQTEEKLAILANIRKIDNQIKEIDETIEQATDVLLSTLNRVQRMNTENLEGIKNAYQELTQTANTLPAVPLLQATISTTKQMLETISIQHKKTVDLIQGYTEFLLALSPNRAQEISGILDETDAFKKAFVSYQRMLKELLEKLETLTI